MDRQKDEWKDRRKNGQTLFYRTLSAEARDPKKTIISTTLVWEVWLCCGKNVTKYHYLIFIPLN